ncbi:hypothetical protein MMPV_006023 [Pyropia vietnamensis]
MASLAPAFCAPAATPLRDAIRCRTGTRGAPRSAASVVAPSAFVGRRAAVRVVAPVVGGAPSAAPPLVMAMPLATVKAGMLVYALLMGGGGLGAYVKTKSNASAISGVGAAAALVAAYSTESVPGALAVAVGLTAVFAVRYVKTKKVMPAAVLGAVSAAAAVFFGVNL